MYRLLPSQVRDNATTYDIMVMDAYVSWENEQRDIASGKKPVPKLTTEEMQAMIDRVRSPK